MVGAPEKLVGQFVGFSTRTDRIEQPQSPVPKSSNVGARTLSVEAVLYLASEILWPEVGHKQLVEIDEFDAHRAQEYSLLAMLLSRSPDAAALNRIARLRGDAIPLGLAHVALAQAAGNASAERISREYFTLFIGVGRGDLLPYGSYYLTGFLNERPLARLREELPSARTVSNAPRDRWSRRITLRPFAKIMAGMASGQFPTTGRMQQDLFEKDPPPWWVRRFFVDLERAAAAEFYRQVGTLGRLFLETETEAFKLPTKGCSA